MTDQSNLKLSKRKEYVIVNIYLLSKIKYFQFVKALEPPPDLSTKLNCDGDGDVRIKNPRI